MKMILKTELCYSILSKKANSPNESLTLFSNFLNPKGKYYFNSKFVRDLAILEPRICQFHKEISLLTKIKN
jgi:hypothetical protein